MEKNEKIKLIRDILNIPPELRIGQYILNNFPITIEIDNTVLNRLNKQIQEGGKVEITKELLKHMITLNDFYWKSDKDFII